MIKKLLLLLGASLSLVAAPYWIQVSSVDTKKTVAPSLIDAIKKSGFSYKVVTRSGDKKIRIGAFSSYKEAAKALPKIRCKVAYDAFIVPNVSVKPQAVPVKTKIVEKAVPQNVTATKAVSAPPAVLAAPTPCECIYDVHLLRKTELEKALTYYKKSPFYEFEP
ncbi:MAG: hypothetical protein DSZ03_07710 [Sulfurimonas sp.]|nr:MAG: hypothetical protein DSZ03_07710 [Sulfurimonas sp.]